jgi:hypothetical protein
MASQTPSTLIRTSPPCYELDLQAPLDESELLRALLRSASIHPVRSRGQEQAGDHEVPQTVHRSGDLSYPCSSRPP